MKKGACARSCHIYIYIYKGRVYDFEIVIHNRLSLEAKPMKKKNSTVMAKPIPVVACESHNNSRKQPYTTEEVLSESEINAVMQLIQLSGADSYSDHTDHQVPAEDDDDNSSNINNSFSFSSFRKVESGKSSVDDAAASSSYSSSSSPVVAVVLSMEAEKGELAEEDDDGDDFDRSNFGAERRNKRYRSIVELYRVTDETVLMSVVRKKKKMQQSVN